MFEVTARLKIRDGELDGFKQQAAEMMRLTRELDTGTLAYDWFLSEDGSECEVFEAYVDLYPATSPVLRPMVRAAS